MTAGLESFGLFQSKPLRITAEFDVGSRNRLAVEMGRDLMSLTHDLHHPALAGAEVLGHAVGHDQADIAGNPAVCPDFKPRYAGDGPALGRGRILVVALRSLVFELALIRTVRHREAGLLLQERLRPVLNGIELHRPPDAAAEIAVLETCDVTAGI